MSPEDRERSYLVDMLQYSWEIIEIIREAANHVSVPTQKAMPKIAWSRIIGMRNKIAHDYGMKA